MEAISVLLQFLVIGGFILFAYTKIKGQTMRDTFDDLKSLFEKFKNG